MMSSQQGSSSQGRQAHTREPFWVGLARAFGVALIFGLPLFMTMEMWWLGFYIARWRLVVLLIANIPVLVALARYGGFQETFRWRHDLVDAFTAYGVGIVTAAVVLGLLAVLRVARMGTATPWTEALAKIGIESVGGSFGALVARSELGGHEAQQKEEQEQAGYLGTLVIMLLGGLFLSLTIAPTREVPLIAFAMTPWHAVAMVIATLLIMDAFVYSMGFAGGEEIAEGTSRWVPFLRFTVVGYVIALAVSLFILWVLGRFTGTGTLPIIMMTVVLAFPAGVGAAAARLIL